jgi:hypothetical protein
MGRSFYGEGQTSASICVIAIAVKEHEGCGLEGVVFGAAIRMGAGWSGDMIL